MEIKIVSSYNEMAWYSGLIGETFQVAELDKRDAVRIKNENEINSLWVENGDYVTVSE